MDLDDSPATDAHPTVQDGSLDATGDVNVDEPSISFDFVSGPEFELPSTDDGSQDIATAALAALSEKKDEMSSPEQNDAPEQDQADELEEMDAPDQHGSLQDSVDHDQTDMFNQDRFVDKMDISEEMGVPLSPDSSLRDVKSGMRIEVRLPELSAKQRAEYSTVESHIIESILQEERLATGDASFRVMFTDGREDELLEDDLFGYEGAKTALMAFYNPPRKRKRHHDDWDSDLGSEPDSVDLDNDIDDDEDDLQSSESPPNRTLRSLRSREPSAKQLSQTPAAHSLNEADKMDIDTSPPPSKRVLRTRQPQRAPYMDDKDELAEEPSRSGDDDDAKYLPVVRSDVVLPKGRPRIRRLQSSRPSRSSGKSLSRPRRQNLSDSDIEFEAPRRSGRATRNKVDMRDDADMDEESFYVDEERPASVPKVTSIREVFEPISPDSPFASIHMDTCHTCGGGRQRGQLIHCQGCSLSYHKNCLGYRSAREHMVTKVGDGDFVLQCRLCINIYRKKDKMAPRFDMCQDCKEPGKSCAAFSVKKTARQEEKLREENDGTDPITPVNKDLINNPSHPLFRCVRCHRGWHIEHLPPAGRSPDQAGSDLRMERLKDYSVDWECTECSLAAQKIHRLVAWRPIEEQVSVVSTTAVEEDKKEYLVKWEDKSYFHCEWKPGAWVYGVSAATMRNAFYKRDLEQGLMKLSMKDAIPDEFLMADVVLNVKMNSSAPKSRTKHEHFENIGHVRKILVKFQGLGYDDVVWDTPPRESAGKDIWNAYLEAYFDYLEGKYFHFEPQSKIRDRVKAYKSADFEEVEEQPAGLKRGKLMAYQVEGLNWMLRNYHSGRSVVLADEMGLGKTVQVVALVASLTQDEPKCWPFLIVVPNATCPNWRREFKQWAPDLRVVTYHGGRAPQELAYKYELFPGGSSEMKAHVVIMSYDSASDPQTKLLFKNIHWAGLVVDEGQRLKNDQNLLYLALRSMKIPFRLLLTGTPLQNNKRELFNLLQFIDETQHAATLDEEFQVLDKETLPKLHDKIRPYFLRRTKAGVLKFLPPMAQIILPVTMTVLQERLAKSIMAKNPQLIKAMFANSKMNKKERGSLNNILMQLRKCLCHPFIYSEAIEERHHDNFVVHQNLIEASSKLLLLQVMLPKLQERGHRVLIFSQFLQQLDIIEDFLNGMGFGFRRLDGSISSLEKQRRIDAFNAPDSELFAFLLSTRAGGVGINLATADTVIIMDPDFNPHQDIQALSRAHRIGQKKKVLCFQLVTKDSVEEKIMQMGRKKMALDHALIESMDDDDIGGDDLESILKHGAQALFDENHKKESIHYDAASVDKLLDRSEMEQAQTNAEGSTEFTYAKVWANESTGFQGTLGAEETDAPEVVLNSSVWDRIIAQREEEARKEAEASREVLGRGGRRRGAPVTYNSSHRGTRIPGLEDGDANSAASDSDEYPGAESDDDSEDAAASSGQGNRRKPASQSVKTPTKTQTHTPSKRQSSKKEVSKKAVDKTNQQKRSSTPSSSRKKSASGSKGSSGDFIKKTPRKPASKTQVQQVTPASSRKTSVSRAPAGRTAEGPKPMRKRKPKAEAEAAGVGVGAGAERAVQKLDALALGRTSIEQCLPTPRSPISPATSDTVQ